MAIRKPTAPAAKSSVMAEFLSGALAAQDSKFVPGSLIDGIVSAVKGGDVFVDIGYKSEGVVPLADFTDATVVKPGYKFPVMLVELENDKSGMVNLSKHRADEKIRWDAVLAKYTEGSIFKGQIRTQVRGGLIVD